MRVSCSADLGHRFQPLKLPSWQWETRAACISSHRGMEGEQWLAHVVGFYTIFKRNKLQLNIELNEIGNSSRCFIYAVMT